jgi:hypothetical protein
MGVSIPPSILMTSVQERASQRELIVPYNPQQSGVAERKDRAIVGVARSMLHDQGLPLFLWAEACYTKVYLQNKILHRALGDKTPEEVFI